jgi:predicted transcriptional regulator of viral defense system
MPAECYMRSLTGNGDSTRPDVLVARLAAEQFGVVSLGELRLCGVSRKAVMVRVRNGRLHPLYRGVYAVGHANPSLEGRFLAAVKACGPGAALSHYSAAAHYGLVTWDDRYPEVTAATTARRHRGIRAHRSSRLEVQDTTRHKGIPITTPARTLIDLAATFTYEALRRTVREAQRRLVTIGQILEALDRLGARRGTANLGKILATGPAPTRSELEDTVLDLLLQGGFAHPDGSSVDPGLEPLGVEARRDVDVDHPQLPVTGVREPVRLPGRRHDDLAAAHDAPLVAEREVRLPLEDDEHLLVGMAMERRAAAGRVVDDDHADAGTELFAGVLRHGESIVERVVVVMPAR